MIIKQISVVKTVTNLKGEPFNVMLTAELKEKEDITVGILKLNQLIDSKSACLKSEHNDLGVKKTLIQASDLCWARLRQVLLKKKGMRGDEEMLEYAKVRIGTDNLDWVSEEEVEKLINEIDKE